MEQQLSKDPNNDLLKSDLKFDRSKLGPIGSWWLDVDKINLFLILSLLVFGVIISASASTTVAKRIGSSEIFFVKKQIVFALVGFVILISSSFLTKDTLIKASIIGMIAAVCLLALVLVMGDEVKGAKRWISIYGITLQPSEITKTIFAVFNAYLLVRFRKNLCYVASVCSYAIIAALLMLEPDFGMTLTFTAIWISQLFIFGIPTFLIFVASIGAVVCFVCTYFAVPHVKERIDTFLDSSEKNYQVERAMDSFVNGSFFGVGPQNGVVKNYIPDSHSDFVFPVIAEEYGIIVCTAIVLIFAYLVARISYRSYHETDPFSSITLIGLMTQFACQAIVNMGVGLRLMPTKGMTLPFISYGGSSTVSIAICFGIILSLTMRKYHVKTDYGNIKMVA